VDRYAPVSIIGQVNLLSATAYTDLAMTFRNMELTTFNPTRANLPDTASRRASSPRSCATTSRIGRSMHSTTSCLTTRGSARRYGKQTAVPLQSSWPWPAAEGSQWRDRYQPAGHRSLDDPNFRVGPIVWKLFTGLLRKIVTRLSHCSGRCSAVPRTCKRRLLTRVG